MKPMNLNINSGIQDVIDLTEKLNKELPFMSMIPKEYLGNRTSESNIMATIIKNKIDRHKL